jgi:hypothetical protein
VINSGEEDLNIMVGCHVMGALSGQGGLSCRTLCHGVACDIGHQTCSKHHSGLGWHA